MGSGVGSRPSALMSRLSIDSQLCGTVRQSRPKIFELEPSIKMLVCHHGTRPEAKVSNACLVVLRIAKSVNRKQNKRQYTAQPSLNGRHKLPSEKPLPHRQQIRGASQKAMTVAGLTPLCDCAVTSRAISWPLTPQQKDLQMHTVLSRIFPSPLFLLSALLTALQSSAPS